MVNFDFQHIHSFDESFFESGRQIGYIGTGSMGGKARGLALMDDMLRKEPDCAGFRTIKVTIPRMVVILTDVFDAFMQHNNLYDIASSDLPDERIAMAFQKAELPFGIPGILRTFISKIYCPLAIRSSGLLEDSLNEPFAGIYGTKMTPNNQPDIDTRYRKLMEAIKYVYASTFFSAARDYRISTGHSGHDEKMAVIMQEVVGSRHTERFYPEISGVARSYNYYPFGHAKPADGIVNLALGLGKTIVDGGFSWSYSPAFPKAVPPFNSTDDMLKQTQTEFWAVNTGVPPEYDPIRETEFLIKNTIDTAETDDTLKQLVSTYDSASDRIWMGLSGDGPRILTFAPILQAESIPLNQVVKTLLEVCEKTLQSPVEIEFAMTSDDYSRPEPSYRFGFLQVRPMLVSSGKIQVPEIEAVGNKVFVYSWNVLGNGEISSVRDILYVKPEKLEFGTATRVANDIEIFNRKMLAANCPYLLIGHGRWGTSDPSAGIPVRWNQISGAKVIIEATKDNTFTEMSQGSHFFHNVTSFKVFYFSLPAIGKNTIDWQWLNGLPAVQETEFIKHISIRKEFIIRADGQTGRGIILKP